MEKTYSVKYRAFGLHLISDIYLPEMPEVEISNQFIDVEIRKGDLSKLWEEKGILPNKNYFVEKDFIMFQVPGLARFLIQDGDKITVSPLTGSDLDQLRLFILGTCMGAILMQRKILPLHGSVVAIDGKAYAIVGDSGAGKSTLASAFLKKGYKMLTDDVIAVSFSEEGIPYVTPSYPQQKLWSESLNHFGIESSHYKPLFDREDKFAIPVQSQYVDTPLPLAGIFELVKGDYEEVEMQPIQSLERLFKLYYHTYRNFFLERAGLMEWHFQTTSKLANKVDFYQLRRPIDKFTANDLADLILQTIQKEETVNV